MVASLMPEEAILDAGITKRLIVQRWLYWGVIPIVVALALTVIATYLVPPKDLSEIQSQNVLELCLAIAAALFLLGFSIDGHVLNPERLAKAAIGAAGASGLAGAGLDPGSNPHGRFVRARVLRTASIVSVLGVGIGAAAVLDVVFGGTQQQGMLLIVLGVLYELYVLSRHPHYRELIEGYARLIAAHQPSDEDGAGDDAEAQRRGRR